MPSIVVWPSIVRTKKRVVDRPVGANGSPPVTRVVPKCVESIVNVSLAVPEVDVQRLEVAVGDAAAQRAAGDELVARPCRGR